MPKEKTFDIDAAISEAKLLFQTKGYAGTSMQDIVDHLGLSRSSIYDTFGDKEQLYLRTLSHYCQENVFRLNEEAEKTADPLAFIVGLMDDIVKDIEHDKGEKGCFVVNAMVEIGEKNPLIFEATNRSNNTFEAMLTALIGRAQRKGQIKSNEPAALLAKYLLNVINGLRVYSKGNNCAKDIKAIANFALKTLQG